MLADLTPDQFNDLSRALHLAQAMGEASGPGVISYRELAEWFQTTPQDIRIHELAALEKMRQALGV
ncbi:MAG: hypothetical protein WCK77_24270 [Verrucomicrobiota bacterium]